MRFKLLLKVEKQSFGNILPLNYQYEQSAAIYRILSKASEEYATWLHSNGFKTEEGKTFKLFAFSRFKIEKRKVLKEQEQIIIFSDTIEWQISFLPEVSTEKFIQGLFANQVFEIGDKRSVVQFRVQNIEVLPSSVFTEEMEFSTMSPMCFRALRADGTTEYLSPADERIDAALQMSLADRYKAFYGKPYEGTISDVQFTLLDEPKSALIKIKANTPQQTKVKGYMCKFRMKAPAELMKIMYESGIGEECAQGFGCVIEIKK